jgi:ribonuclease BN (tRNA processing enzyme)
MRLTIAGCGDAFGSGGRLNTCFHVDAGTHRFLIDCGASALIGLRQAGLDLGGVGTILISHLHGDHYIGLVFAMLEAQHISRRSVPLTIAGPPGIEARFAAAAEALFPGSMGVPRRFDMRFVEYTIGRPQEIGPLRVTATEVSHPSGAPSCALRIVTGGKTIAFSGDTEWVEELVEVARGADLFITECYGYDKAVRYHLDWRKLEAELPRLEARRILLTHMNADMLANRHKVRDPRVVLAEDRMGVDV